MQIRLPLKIIKRPTYNVSTIIRGGEKRVDSYVLQHKIRKYTYILLCILRKRTNFAA